MFTSLPEEDHLWWKSFLVIYASNKRLGEEAMWFCKVTVFLVGSVEIKIGNPANLNAMFYLALRKATSRTF